MLIHKPMDFCITRDLRGICAAPYLPGLAEPGIFKQYKSPLIITDQRAFFYLFINTGAPAYKILWNILAEEIQYIDARCLRRFLNTCERANPYPD